MLPRYDLLVRDDGDREVGADYDFCNWLQRSENGPDPAHLVSLHAAVYPETALKRPILNFERTRFGIKVSYDVVGVFRKPRVFYALFPSIRRVTTGRIGQRPDHSLRISVPTDDHNTTTFWVRFYPRLDGTSGTLETRGYKNRQPGTYERVDDGWWGIASHDQDVAAQETQGLIADRTSMKKFGRWFVGLANTLCEFLPYRTHALIGQ